MTLYERENCIDTIRKLQRAANKHGQVNATDVANCDKLVELLNGGINKIYEKHYKQGLKDAVDKPEAIFDPD